MSTQFLMWDKFKDMKKLSQVQREHLSTLLSQLLSSKAMSLSVLKVRITLRLPPPLVIFPQPLIDVQKLPCMLQVFFSKIIIIIVISWLRSHEKGWYSIFFFQNHFIFSSKIQNFLKLTDCCTCTCTLCLFEQYIAMCMSLISRVLIFSY